MPSLAHGLVNDVIPIAHFSLASDIFVILMHRKMLGKPSFLIVVAASLLASFCPSLSTANVIKDLLASTPASATSSPPLSSASSTSGSSSEGVTLSQHGIGHEIKSDLTSHSTVAPATIISSPSHVPIPLLPNHHESGGVTVHHEAASSSAAATATSAASAVLEGHKAMTTMLPNVASSDHTIENLHHNTSASSSSSATSAASLSLHKPLATTTMVPSVSHTTSTVHDSIDKVAKSLESNATLITTTMAPIAIHHQLDTAKTSAASSGSSMALSSLGNSSTKAITTSSAPVHREKLPLTSNVTSNSSLAAPMKEEAKSPLSKFCDYMKPICASLEKILPKQLFKIQSQLKQFVQMSNGKLSMCFLEHYELDPNLKEVSKNDLNRICLSKDIPAGKKGSLKDFESCAAKNWEPAIDKEIDRINIARLNSIKNHDHTSAKNATVASITTTAGEAHADLEHEEDEVSLINEVVSKMLDDKGTLSKNTDINVIDMSSKANSSSSASASSRSGLSASSSSLSSAKAKGILNDPNTVVVFVDEGPSTKSTTRAPLAAVDKQTSSISILPHQSTIKPPVAEMKETKVISKTKAESEASGSIKSMITTMTTTIKPLASLVTRKTEVAKKVENKLMGTTMAPMVAEKKVIGKTMPPIALLKATTLKPLETLEEMLKRQEKEKIEFENRLRLEREKVFRQMQRKQDELDAQNAIKALQVQRQATSSASASSILKDNHDSDEHMHKLEHERQMAIDPIGHTIKHQQYELNKQQRMFG